MSIYKQLWRYYKTAYVSTGDAIADLQDEQKGLQALLAQRARIQRFDNVIGSNKCRVRVRWAFLNNQQL